MMRWKLWEVWVEGFVAQGNANYAWRLGYMLAPSHLLACRWLYRLARMDPFHYREAEGIASYWGCRMWDNEEDARSSFG